MHFFSINARTGLPTFVVSEEEDDPNFRLKEPGSAEKLLETWKKDQKYLEHELEMLFKFKKTHPEDHGRLGAS